MTARRSALLSIRLALARLRGAGLSAHDALDKTRPDGPLIWIVFDHAPDSAPGAGLLLRRLSQLHPDLDMLVSAPRSCADILPPDAIRIDPAEDSPALIERMLSHWRPDLVVLTGSRLPLALIGTAWQQGVPVMAVDCVLSRPGLPRGFLRRRLDRALLSRLCRISVRDAESLALLVRLGTDPAKIEVGGILAEPPSPLHCSEVERASIAEVTRTRPVWLAAAVPEAEIRPVVEAHRMAQRHAHRMLLILVPETPQRGASLAEELSEEGWITGRRTVEGEPDPDTQIFIVDEPAEYGLWYRVAPVTYMGGTLRPGAPESVTKPADGTGRAPLEPAALGSAILHGPETAPYERDYAGLDAAQAARGVVDARDLGEAVSDLMAADRAAMLAHNAWAVTSAGAGAAEAVAHAILTELDNRHIVPGALPAPQSSAQKAPAPKKGKI